MDMPTKTFLVGMLGALAPEIVRHFRLARDGKKFTWSWYLLVASAIYAGLGGFVAMILPSENLLAALYSGISTDVLVSKATERAAGTRDRVAAAHKSAATGASARLSPLDSFLDAL